MCISEARSFLSNAFFSGARSILRTFIVYLSLGLTLAILGITGYFLYENNRIFNRKINPEADVISSQIVVVKGHSLAPFILEGEKLATLWQPEFLETISRNDIVILSIESHASPLVKIVFGLPGDTWDVIQKPNGHFSVLINNEILKNPVGVEYSFSPEKVKILQMQIKITKKIIPEGTYLVFGANPSGTTDSSVFGLIETEQILGKAYRLN